MTHHSDTCRAVPLALGGQHGPYGKLLLVDPADHRCHSVFFDDNITLDAEEPSLAWHFFFQRTFRVFRCLFFWGRSVDT